MSIKVPQEGECVNCYAKLTTEEQKPVPYCTACRTAHPEVFEQLTKQAAKWGAR